MPRCKMNQPERAAYLRVFCVHLLTDEDFETLDRAQFGSACLLMFHAWAKQGSLPADPRKLAALARCTVGELEDLRAAWPKLVPLEDLDDTAEPGARVTIPYLWREWQQVMGFYEAQRQRSAQGVAARKAKGSPEPPADHPKPEPMGQPMGQPLGVPYQDQDQDQDQAKKEGSKDPSTPAPRKRGPAAKKADSLEDILRGGKGTPTWEAYWKLAGTFGGQPKNPAPMTTARLYVQALDAGATLEQIQAKADTLRAGTSEIRYMPQLQKWLEGQGYLTPDLSTTTPGGTHGPAMPSTPHHRSATDASFAQQLQAHRAQHGPVRLAGEGNAEELQRLLGAD